jgi:hypothetical protein
MADFVKKLEPLFKCSEEMVATFAKSDVIREETGVMVEGLVYANVIANFRRNLTERNTEEYGLSKDELGTIKKEFKRTYDVCDKVIRTASNKEKVNSDFYMEFRNRVRNLSKGCFNYLLEIEKRIDLSSCEKRIAQFKKGLVKLGIDNPDDSTMLSTIMAEAFLGSGKDFPNPQKISKIIKEAISKTLPDASEELLKELKKDSPEMPNRRKKEQTDFEDRIELRWGEAFELMELYYVLAFESGEAFNDKHREEAALGKNYLFDALTRIHARSCQIFYEIMALLKAGLADGAMARWRSLHELAVIALFLNEHGSEVAERYLAHALVENYKETKEYQKHCRKLGYEPIDRNEMRKLKRRKEAVCVKYGEDFHDDYGWVPRNILRSRNFKEIERSIRMDRWRPFYKMACLNVHAFAKGLKHRLGLFRTGSQQEVLLAGPSNYGLADPAQNAAISLHQVTTGLLTTRPTIERLIAICTMQRLVDEIGTAFCRIQIQIEREEKRKECRREKRRNRIELSKPVTIH